MRILILCSVFIIGWSEWTKTCNTPHGWCDPFTNTCHCSYPYDDGNECANKRCVQGCMQQGTANCDGTTGLCVCNTGFWGPHCEFFDCPNNCNNNGSCDRLTGICDCFEGWFGEDCAEVRCVNDCNGQGRCVSGVCQCYSQNFGDDCGSINCPRDCGELGGCNFATGECTCDNADFTDPDCMYTTCPNNCNTPNGTCDIKTGKCYCAEGYSKYDCSYDGTR